MRKRMRKRIIKLAALVFALCALPAAARAQFIGYTSPQTVQVVPLNTVTAPVISPTGAGAGTCPATAGNTCAIPNIGQVIHILTYTVAGSSAGTTSVDIRLEASNDGVTFFPISDDATDPTQGQVYAVGYYPVVRVNLATFSNATSLTASYVGASSVNGPPRGLFNSSQMTRKVAFSNLSKTSVQNALFGAPYGSTSGILVLISNNVLWGVGSQVSVNAEFAGNAQNVALVTIPNTGSAIWVIPVASVPADSINVQWSPAGSPAGSLNAYYYTYPAGQNLAPSAQPPAVSNSEAVSSTNASVQVSVTAAFVQASIFSVSARCSAGTAGLTIKNGSTQIWSSGATEVGTTTFRFQWNPGLASTLGQALTVTLTACGTGNTGTIDVQGSQN